MGQIWRVAKVRLCQEERGLSQRMGLERQRLGRFGMSHRQGA